MKGLLSVSFGTSHADTRAKTIDAIDEDLRRAFPDMPFYTAWTSGRIVAKVAAERGELHDTLEEALARLAADGVDDVVVSTSCLMDGAEMKKVERTVAAWADDGARAAIMARSLLSSAEDRRRVAEAIAGEFADVPEGEALLLMGHGSPQDREANDVYSDIQRQLHALGRRTFHVATVEGAPSFDDVWPAVREAAPRCVHLAPLMIVAGDHARNDLAGQGDSWAARIRAEGFAVNVVLKGLGEYSAIRQLVCDHVNEALVLREVSLRG